ncbi:uncharacterized protein LOC134813996 [Bolinopsis microptera]|uniref:uncharacterized protein LOC134813996 n=1 Tax=Bolinopsis microptera TaxID=2820187 RepID=UPI00307A5F1B
MDGEIVGLVYDAPLCDIIDLNGFENLSGTTAEIINGNDGILKDMNLERTVSSDDAPFTFKWWQRQGIYKVILSATSTDISIAGWKVYVKDTSAQKSDAQYNNLTEEVPCTAGNNSSEGTDSYEFVCQERLAATEVIIMWDRQSGSGGLAEVVVVGKTWATYPCGLGYYNTDTGTHSDTARDGCKVCDDGSHDARTDFTSDPEQAKACTQCDNKEKKIFYTRTIYHKKMNECQSCAAPTVILADKGTCVKCPAGQEYYAEGVDADCNYPANPERASATAVAVTDPSTCTKVECRDCPDGTRNTAESSDYCHSCTHMKEYTTDKIECLMCDVGKIRDSTGNTCEDCPAGERRGISDNDCIPCDSGWMSAAGASVCTECPVGQYEVSMTSCELCPAGKYNDQTGQSGESSCKVCADGTVSNEERTECTAPCNPGWFSQNGGLGPNCKPCDASEYQPYFQQTRCMSCAGTVTPDRTQCDIQAGAKCGAIKVKISWLNGGEEIEFPETSAGSTGIVSCSGTENESQKMYKMCEASGEWDSYTNTESCSTPLSKYTQDAKEIAELSFEENKKELGKAMGSIAEIGDEVIPSPSDVGNIVDLLSACKNYIKDYSSEEVEDLSLSMAKSMEILKKGEPDFLADEKKSEIIDILETMSKSLKDDMTINTNSIVMQSLTSSEEELSIKVPNTAPPITLKLGNQKGKTTKLAVMDESYKSILPIPKTPNTTVGSSIVSLNFMNTNSEIERNDLDFSLIFQEKEVPNLPGYTTKRECGYLNISTNEWLTDGCTTTLQQDKTCTCTCTHTTSFAVLLSPTKVTDPTQDVISYVMFGINIIFLVLTFCLIAPFKKLRSKQVVLIQLNLILALILGNVSFTCLSASTKISVDEAGNPLLSLNTGCVVGVIITQYFLLSALCWMGCTAWTFFGKIVMALKSYGKKDKFFIHKCTALSWLFPLVFPLAAFLTSLSMNGDDYSVPYIGAARKNGTNCWVEDPWRFLGFMVPAYSILLFNCVSFVMIARVIWKSSTSGGGDPKLAKTAKAMALVAVSVGCPWVVIALAVGPGAVVMQYLFIVMTGLQGPLLFIGMALLQEDVWGHTLALLGVEQKKGGKASVTQASSAVSNCYTTTAQNYTTDPKEDEGVIYEDVENGPKIIEKATSTEEGDQVQEKNNEIKIDLKDAEYGNENEDVIRVQGNGKIQEEAQEKISEKTEEVQEENSQDTDDYDEYDKGNNENTGKEENIGQEENGLEGQEKNSEDADQLQEPKKAEVQDIKGGDADQEESKESQANLTSQLGFMFETKL